MRTNQKTAVKKIGDDNEIPLEGPCFPDESKLSSAPVCKINDEPCSNGSCITDANGGDHLYG